MADSVTPQAVAQFLAAHDWELEAQQAGVRQLWRPPGTTGAPQTRVMLPLAQDFVDFHRRFVEALTVLGHVHSVDASQLYERVMGTRADLFFVRLDQTSLDGTIPFKQAEETLQALYKMMRAAATTAADPSHSHLGRRPAAVTEFLEDDVRLGHTKQGSFVFTLVARHGEGDTPSDSPDPVTPFPRRVMETLARGLETTKQLAYNWDDTVLDDPEGTGVSTGLVESLDDIGQAEQLHKLDLTFEWAASEPRPDVGLATIEFGRDVLDRLPVVRERLVRRNELPARVTLVGSVRTLKREEDAEGEEESATVALQADVSGKQRTVHMSLAGDDHRWAIIAYSGRLPFTVTGDLTFERRAWRLSNVEVDPSYFQFRGQRLLEDPSSNHGQ